jgi:hypothetical protein
MMRFHVVKDDDGRDADMHVRVTGPVSREKYHGPPACTCKILYPVIMQSVGREYVEQGAYRDGRKFVCACHGYLVP